MTTSRLDFNASFEHKLCRAGECDIMKPVAAFFEADLKFVTPPRDHTDGAVRVLTGSEDERAGDYSGPTRERFVFHAAFIGADSDFVGSAFFDEVHVCAVRRKHFVMTNRSALTSHINIIDFCNWDYDMRDPAVNEVNRLVFSHHG